ncbi:MAG TPA: hypothetical protein VHV83_17170 [Armatimonadota bacterium]|nr:hypothetical protein [Armatimonadota bacterium]
MERNEQLTGVDQHFLGQWLQQPAPPATLLEARVLELEHMGFADDEEEPGIPSSIRRFAIASLLHRKPPYFITTSDDLLACRDTLEAKYGMMIFSPQEALMLLRDSDGPAN